MKDKNDVDWDALKKDLERASEQAEMIGLDVEVVGNWLWLDGDTRPHANELRSSGFNWSKSKKRWFYRPQALPESVKSDRNVSMDEIRRYYGSYFLNTAPC